MPRDANGVYSLPATYLAVTGSTITALQHNAPLEDLATAITASLPRNGAAAFNGMLRINTDTPTLALQDTDGRTAFPRANGGFFYISRGAANGTIWDSGPNNREPLAISLDTGNMVLSGAWTAYGMSYSYGDIELQAANPSLWLNYPSVKRGRLRLDEFGNMLWSDAGGQNHFYVTPTGAIWSQSLGDIGTRIEDRAAAYAAQRVSKSGDTIAGNLILNGSLTVSNGQASSVLYMDDTDEGKRAIHNNSGQIGFLSSTSTWIFNVKDSGALWTSQFGDLNTRIEARAAAMADDRAGYRVLKAGDIMTGELQLRWSQPTLFFENPGIIGMRMWLTNDGYMRFRNNGASEDRFRVGIGGDVWCAQFGDLNARIEARAASYADDRASHRVDSMRLTGGGDVNWAASTWVGGNNEIVVGLAYGPGTGQIGTIRFRYLQYGRPDTGFVTVGVA